MKALFQRVDSHVLSILGRGAIALDEGEAGTAVDYAQRFLRRMPPEDKVERVPGLELLIRGCAGKGDVARAREALAELQTAIRDVSTESLKGAGRFSEGIVAAAEGQLRRAQECLEDAVDLFGKACMPYESVTARVELARILNRLGHSDRAQSEAHSAEAQAEKLGAVFLTQRADRLLSAPPARPRAVYAEGATETALSPRESEILLLVAEGKDNNRIADELFLSVRTVERHISNAYQKLGISGKSARTTATVYALRNLTPRDRT
jgi:ATP/maltotriose-dependent transcriptional regulator MalT